MSVGPLRTEAILSGHPLVQDVVVAGINRDEVGLLVFPRMDDVRALAGADRHEPPRPTLAHPKVRSFFRNWLKAMWDAGTGSSNRPARALLLGEPPSMDRGELHRSPCSSTGWSSAACCSASAATPTAAR